MLEIPYTGSSPLTQAIIMTKAQTKTVCKAYGIPTLPWQVFERETQGRMSNLKFPLIVKPIAQGSSAGITNDSVVKNELELKKQITFILDTFNEPALVEPFIRGREFSVGLLGNPPRILPFIEADHSTLPKGYEPLDSLEVKWIVEEQASSNHLICPAHIPPSLRGKLESMCLSLWKALNIQDFCRMDVRCDLQGNPFILEVNSPPGLIPPEISKTSYLPMQAKYAGMSYEELLKHILRTARKRLGVAN
jgi:D-alanine-D-alanine ligase